MVTPKARFALLLACGFALVALGIAHFGKRFSTSEVRWTSGGIALEGTVYLPTGDGPHPAAVFLPGHGDWTRDETMFRTHAARLASDGLAMLIYDKRGCGASTGDWRRASLRELAEDALGAARLLRTDPRIRADEVGLFGTSQGGAIALLACTIDPEIAFVATLSLSTRSPAAHDSFIVGATLRKQGVPEDQAARAVALQRQILEVYRTDRGWEEARTALEACRNEPWFAAAGLELEDRDGWKWKALHDLPMDYDPMPSLENLRVPLFAAQGEEDWLVPGPRDFGVLQKLQRAHGKDFTLVMIPGVGHGLRQRTGWPVSRWSWPDAYWRALDGWLDDVVPRR